MREENHNTSPPPFPPLTRAKQQINKIHRRIGLGLRAGVECRYNQRPRHQRGGQRETHRTVRTPRGKFHRECCHRRVAPAEKLQGHRDKFWRLYRYSVRTDRGPSKFEYYNAFVDLSKFHFSHVKNWVDLLRCPNFIQSNNPSKIVDWSNEKIYIWEALQQYII